MNWRTRSAQLALLELAVTGRLHRRRAQADAFAALAELPWTKRTGRRDELALIDERRADLLALLHSAWPDWEGAHAALAAHGLPANPDGIAALEDLERAQSLPPLPSALNRRTAAALIAPHSKSGLTERRAGLLGDASVTHDGVVRMRPPVGLVLHSDADELALDHIARVLGEVTLPERALRRGLRFSGPLAAVLLVENLGAYADTPHPDGWLIVHAPGWDTATAALLLRQLPPAPLLHFGDLDPNGARINAHLARIHPGLRWFVPDFWSEHLDQRGLPCAWPDELDLGAAPELVRTLAARGLWLEQEPIVLDPRLRAALEAALVEPR